MYVIENDHVVIVLADEFRVVSVQWHSDGCIPAWSVSCCVLNKLAGNIGVC